MWRVSSSPCTTSKPRKLLLISYDLFIRCLPNREILWDRKQIAMEMGMQANHVIIASYGDEICKWYLRMAMTNIW